MAPGGSPRTLHLPSGVLASSPAGETFCFLPIRCVRNAVSFLVVILTCISHVAPELGDRFVFTGHAVFLFFPPRPTLLSWSLLLTHCCSPSHRPQAKPLPFGDAAAVGAQPERLSFSFVYDALQTV